MPASINATTVNNLSISTNDVLNEQTYTDTSKVSLTTSWSTGTGLDAINLSYVNNGGAIGSSGTIISFDTYSLYNQIFNKDVYTDFSGGKIMALEFENISTGHSVAATYINTGVEDFSSPFVNSFEYDLYPGSTFSIQRSDGWTVDDNNRYIRFKTNTPLDTNIQIGLIGKV